MKKEILKHAVAFDVSADDLQGCFGTYDSQTQFKYLSNRKFKNKKHGFKSLHKWIAKYHKDKSIPLRILMEATGVYHEQLCYFLVDQGYDVSIVLPNYSSKYLESIGMRSKTDELDAKGLAQMCAERDFPLWQKPNEHIRRLKSLTRFREQLLNKSTALKNQMHANKNMEICDFQVVEHQKDMLEFYEQKTKAIENDIQNTLAEDPALETKIEGIVNSLTGVGQITLVTLVAETGGFQLFENQGQLTGYSGYDVVENQSGKRHGKTKISKKGNSHIRRIMHMPAFSVVTHNTGTFAALYQRVYERTGIKMKGYVAVQRKLLCLIYTLWKNDTVFDPNYHKQQATTDQENNLAPCLPCEISELLPKEFSTNF